MEAWGAVIVAAGKGTRMGTIQSKQYLPLCGKPVLVHTLEKFEQIEEVAEVVLVVGEQDVGLCRSYVTDYKLTKVKAVVAGGAERQDSVYRGLQELDSRWVMIHDGVRPLVSREAVTRCCQAAYRHGAAVLAVPVKDTIKQVNDQGVITGTPDRQSLWSIQTPQAFQRAQIVDALERAAADGFLGTDDAMAVERIGVQVAVAHGEYTNIKITTPEDLPMAELWLSGQK
ncbi:2-C-methyl-D-erythritol 4-phosphate cytidylyltransferase [Paenibacillus sp. GCM10012307]|uniref:2-C-methyl-D-erythritol 4-phosphate cytidylyltransferase n=1 Tax=Paenibacillus roseus TaxID=2798579 RepID=A0A934IXC1_9BACL|nr:2-C-methyl-D-erythritol 4-phosphate cytidylyltransferase [Paenibacillus roseus]MBJ6361006.1 2-C-methyl-D-erythritol 4-phosphate cytidylyltransferase [Paenibacillus roseus]